VLSEEEAKRRKRSGAKIKLVDGRYVQLTPASARTKRKYLANLNGIMRRALKVGAIASNPVPLVERPGGRKSNRKSLKSGVGRTVSMAPEVARALAEHSQRSR